MRRPNSREAGGRIAQDRPTRVHGRPLGKLRGNGHQLRRGVQQRNLIQTTPFVKPNFSFHISRLHPPDPGQALGKPGHPSALSPAPKCRRTECAPAGGGRHAGRRQRGPLDGSDARPTQEAMAQAGRQGARAHRRYPPVASGSIFPSLNRRPVSGAASSRPPGQQQGHKQALPGLEKPLRRLSCVNRQIRSHMQIYGRLPDPFRQGCREGPQVLEAHPRPEKATDGLPGAAQDAPAYKKR